MADRAVPSLPSRDLDATEAFYGGFGFTRSFRDDGWMILRRGSLELEFFPFAELDPARSSFQCSIRVADLDGLHDAIVASRVPPRVVGIPRITPIEWQDWGMRAGYLIDLDGTQLALIEDPGAESAGRAPN